MTTQGIGCLEIEPVQEAGLGAFLVYLDKHLRENRGGASVLFQPMSLEESKLTPELEDRFRRGIRRDSAEDDWRRLFVAVSSGQVCGHVDVRPHPEKHTSHRVLLGIGVDSSMRGRGVGSMLMTSIIDWARSQHTIEYIDLWVLSDNYPARALYEKHGFEKCGEIVDMFRFDGRSHAYTVMSLRVVP